MCVCVCTYACHYLLAVANEQAKPSAHFAVGAQQEPTNKGHQRTDRLVARVRLIVQGQSHSQARQVTLLHLREYSMCSHSQNQSISVTLSRMIM